MRFEDRNSCLVAAVVGICSVTTVGRRVVAIVGVLSVVIGGSLGGSGGGRIRCCFWCSERSSHDGWESDEDAE